MPESPKHIKLLEKVNADYLWAKDYRQQFEPDWQRAYRLYRSYIDKKQYPFESSLFIPYVFAVIEVQLPVLLQTIFGNGEFLDVQGRNIQSQEFASSVKEIISYQFERDIKAFNLMSMWAKQTLLYGTSPAFIDWKYLARPTKVRVPIKAINGTILGEKILDVKRVIANNPVADVIDIFRYFQCPSTVESPAGSDDVLFAGYEFQRTYEELLLDAKNSIYDINQVKKLKGASNNSINSPLENRLNILGKTGSSDRIRNARNIVDGIHYFGFVPDEHDNIRFKLITVVYPSGLPDKSAGEGIIIRDTDDPLNLTRIPISLARVNLMKDELYGIGDVQTVESLQIELNDQRNQRCDNVVRTMDQMYKVKRGLDIDEAQLIYRPGGTIECDDPSTDIVPLNPSTIQLNQSLTEESVIKQDIQFATGVSDFVAGTFQNTTGFNDTATGISLIQAAAQGRIVLKANFLQASIKELAETVWALNQQNLPFDTVIKVLDPFSASKFRFIKSDPSIINGQYDFSIVSAPSTGNPQVRRQQLIQVIDALSKMIPSAQQAGYQIKIEYPQLIMRLLKEFNIPNIAEILPGLVNQQVINGIPELLNQTLDDGESIGPEAELQLFLDGEKNVAVRPGDDDLVHIIGHKDDYDSIKESDIREEILKHIELHTKQLSNKQGVLYQAVKSGELDIQQNGQASNIVSDIVGLVQQAAEEGGGNSPNGAEGNEAITKELGDANQLTAL